MTEPGLTAERLTPLVEREIHRVLCMGAHHRSPFTGPCRAAPNIARGLVYWLSDPSQSASEPSK